MVDRSSDAESTVTAGDAESTATVDDSGSAETAGDPDDSRIEIDDAGVDEAVKRRLREAYLNDEENALIVTAVRSVGDRVAVELRPPHGDATHTERFDAPRGGSLAESEEFLAFLEAAGVSPLDVDELVGTRVPATYDPEEGWRVDPAYLGESASGAGLLGRPADGDGRLADARDRLWTYRTWLLAALLVGGELAFVVVLILLYG